MSRRYTSDGRRISSQAHARHTWTCSCGLVTAGNGGKSSHRRACAGRWLTWTEAYDRRLAEWERAQVDVRMASLDANMAAAEAAAGRWSR
jgi:hypothetical protein